MESMWNSHFRSWEMLVPRNLNESTAATVLFMMVSGGSVCVCGGGSPEVHDHLQSFDRVELQVVVIAPDSQLFNLLSVSRLVTVLIEADNCGVICELQELDRGVFRCAVIGVQGEEQWEREHIPEGHQCWSYRCWMRIFPASLAAACLSGSWWSTDTWRWAQRAELIWTGGGLGWWCWRPRWSPQTGSLHKSLVYPNVVGYNAVPFWLHHPPTCLLGKQTAGGPVRVQWCPSGGPVPVFQMTSWPQMSESGPWLFFLNIKNTNFTEATGLWL